MEILIVLVDEIYHLKLSMKAMKLDTFSLFKFSDHMNDSAENALNALKWLIAPMDLNEFLE